jgi:hypothetical protein
LFIYMIQSNVAQPSSEPVSVLFCSTNATAAAATGGGGGGGGESTVPAIGMATPGGGASRPRNHDDDVADGDDFSFFVL